MSKEILLVVDAVSNEKGVAKTVIFEALEAALASATAKRHNDEIEARVAIDRETGEYETFRRWEVLEDDAEMESEDHQILHKDALAHNPELEVGGYIEEPMDNVEFGRIAAQTAKQVIVQRVREAEREQVVDAYKDREGELINGIVKRIERGNVYLDLGGNAEAFVAQRHMIQGETVRPGDRMRAYLYEVKPDVRGPQLFASRTIKEFLIALFELEVPEIGQELISIMGGARDPGRIVVDEERRMMDIAVDDANLSQAIGRGGQNVRLASDLSGWELNILTVQDADKKSEEEAGKVLAVFMERLDVDEGVANILVAEGFSNIEEVAYVPDSELLEIEEFDEDMVVELRRRARDALLTQLIAKEEVLDENKPAEDLLSLEGMTERLAFRLAEKGTRTQEDLAELAVDELLEVDDMPEEEAAALIMAARAPWFEEDQE